ncbi:MAG: DegT/DnrJ/EryC1/StrS family aminotransferase [Coriobacteriia bacterium]|nr:DegT/DnrJ/EryC1/StrS family aminotransferase [Coriobacteriia bacterium]
MNVIPFNDLSRDSLEHRHAYQHALDEVIQSGWYISGPHVSSFCEQFARYLAVRSCIGVGNGTDALEIGLRALEVGLGDEVITVANAGGYSSTAIALVGAIPVYVDINEHDHLMNVELVSAALTKKTKAVIATHLYGSCVNMQRLIEITSTAGIPILEDCAQAHGAEVPVNGCLHKAGASGTLGAFSFYPTKNLGCFGDGGALVTQDEQLAQTCCSLARYGWRHKRYMVSDAKGRNSRLDEVQAAMLLEKLPRLDAGNERRREILQRYVHAVSSNEDVLMLQADDKRGVAHLAVARTQDRVHFQAYCDHKRIQTAIHYPILDHHQSGFSPIRVGSDLEVSERTNSQITSLPCFPTLAEEEVTYVCDALSRYRLSWNP